MIGNGDKAIPIIDLRRNNGDSFFDPLHDYVWDGRYMGMLFESLDASDVQAFWPGLDALVNGHLGLLNVMKSTPVYDEAGLHRARHPGAGAITPYGPGPTEVSRFIPAGGELFKHYGDVWFIGRENVFGRIPVLEDYWNILTLMGRFQKVLPLSNDNIASALYNDVIVGMKDLWDSRALNALHDFSLDDIRVAVEAEDMGILFQPAATRSIDWLNEHG